MHPNPKKKKCDLKHLNKEFLSAIYPSFQSDENSNFFIDNSTESKFFQKLGQIGEDATSVTYKVIDIRTKQPLCKKVIKYNNGNTTIKDAQNALKEFQVMHAINYPCICKSIYINTADELEIINKGEKETVTTVSLFIEFLEYSLKDVLEWHINNTLKVKIVIEIAHAMKYMHKHGMIHRDLKIENIRLNSIFETKLVDFGLVRINECLLNGYSFVEDSLTKGVGTLAYMSPEMLNEEDYDCKTDVYSFGVILYFMFFGSIPKQSLKDKTNGKPITVQFSPSPSVSSFCIELIRKCLSPNPSDRPSFKMILDEIRKNGYELASNVDPVILTQRDKQLKIIGKIQ
ncbi:hypothetical protein M9Y10_043426 [Tritrichomonas musculus]|uniref:Protein kinase domain-containing protein n=1 Tax=Tritrichomonas musculus TaxID=1915356 RepID=A0ABR2JZQ3_9EUKA